MVKIGSSLDFFLDVVFSVVACSYYLCRYRSCSILDILEIRLFTVGYSWSWRYVEYGPCPVRSELQEYRSLNLYQAKLDFLGFLGRFSFYANLIFPTVWAVQTDHVFWVCLRLSFRSVRLWNWLIVLAHWHVLKLQ